MEETRPVLHYRLPWELSAPWAVLSAGLPQGPHRRLRSLSANPLLRTLYRLLQSPWIAPG